MSRTAYDSFAIAVSRSLAGLLVCVFGVTNALAQTNEKIIVLPQQGIPSCQLTESEIRFRIAGEVDAADEEAVATEMPVAPSNGSGRLDIRSAASNALIGRVEISPATVSEPVTITEPGIYDVQMRVPRDHQGWQRWLRLDSLTERDGMDVVRSWTVIVFPTTTAEQTQSTTPTAGVPGPMDLKPRQMMTPIDTATLRSWCSNAAAETSAKDRSLLNWTWRHEDAPVSEDAMHWQARLDCLKRELKVLRDQGVDAIVLPIPETAFGADPESSVPSQESIEDAMLARLAAEEMIQLEGQVWLEPPHLQCGAPVNRLVDSWNEFWGDGQASGFVVRWQSETIQCRSCGHHHATEALLPIIANLNNQHLILVEDANVETASTADATSEPTVLPLLRQTLAEVRRLQPERTSSQVWLVSDHRRERPPRLSAHFPITDGHASEPANGFWLGYQPVSPTPDSASLVEGNAVSMEQIDDQWIQWWDQPARAAGMPRDSVSSRFLLFDHNMLDSSIGRAACHAWKHWNENLISVPAEVANGQQRSVDGLVTVSVHPSSHSLVLVNRAPWTMSVSLTTTEATVWKITPDEDAIDLTLTVPEQTALGARLKLPPRQMVICQSESPLPRKFAWTGSVSDPATMMPRITEQVTMVVEHVGLLSELDRLPRELKTLTPEAESQAAPARSSIDRWNPGRVIQASTTLLRSPKPATPHFATKSSPSLLSNGGFEQSSLPDATARLGIPNWMHAQHPADAVKLDSRSAFRGEHSVRLAARDESGTQAWLISKNIATPVAGRVAISMAVRGYREPRKETTTPGASAPAIANPTAGPPTRPSLEPLGQGNEGRQGTVAEPSKTLTLRVALEGSLDGQPCRHWREVEVPIDGKWQDSTVVLEWLNVDVERTRDLRVTIDNLSDGIIWVDDVFVTDWFASRVERAEIQSLAYLAVQGLQRDDVKSPARLLNQFWAKQLLQFAVRRSTDPRRAEVNRPLVQPVFGRGVASPMAIATAAPVGLPTETMDTGKTMAHPAGTAGATETPTETQPLVDSSQQNAGVTGRIRNWLPQPLRF
ncbi:hypothetical protein [Rhodopirellula sp. P2]|uniref:hypothetical protein n=1 Tax=Rhodopirellula sp. P2 TaxID=2127060 RepID=UPI002367F259|nr:hypothetical protein [Rhodopirellula sp. P2]WDQ16689.1 hypothetical protein PSR62_24185 [Rhodopirellula sp. P2]